jgi:transcriptional adapter 2-alpha
VERGIVNDFKKTVQNEKKLSRDERELSFMYRPFARFIRQEEFDELVQGLIRERLIRNRIETLKQYRSLGITTLQDADRYELEKKRRDADIEARRRRHADRLAS